MKATLVRLPEDLYEGLRNIAFHEKVSVAELIRQAVVKVYGQDIEDVRIGEEALAEYRANPQSARSWEEFRKEWLGEEPTEEAEEPPTSEEKAI